MVRSLTRKKCQTNFNLHISFSSGSTAHQCMRKCRFQRISIEGLGGEGVRPFLGQCHKDKSGVAQCTLFSASLKIHKNVYINLCKIYM